MKYDNNKIEINDCLRQMLFTFTPNDNSFVFLLDGLKGMFFYSAGSNPQDLSKRYYTFYADIFNRTPSRLLWEAFSKAAITAHIIFVYK